MTESLLAFLLGVLQGVFEWLPISSEGNVAMALTALGRNPESSVQLALFLHLGTAMAATVYYRRSIVEVLETMPEWRPRTAFERGTAETSFLAIATIASGVVGVIGYALLEEAVSTLSGGAFVALIGFLLIVTGVLQRTAGDGESDDDGDGAGAAATSRRPTAFDAVLVGALQGLAVLPGVSRSGTTTSALLLRRYEGEQAFRLSFLLSIPAALGAGLLVALDAGGVPNVSPASGAIALATAAVVGYATIDLLMRVVRRVAFWGVCVGLGALAVVGGALVVAV
ncbi:MAG TPA: undecaprenyl-diphosphate phosphatase [Natrialbaceae archaeon]|nr:undecaprenyl-diphosphate phosphatase [Natrialbaceae archaeon]